MWNRRPTRKQQRIKMLKLTIKATPLPSSVLLIYTELLFTKSNFVEKTFNNLWQFESKVLINQLVLEREELRV